MSDLLTSSALANLTLALGPDLEAFLERLPRLVQEVQWSTGVVVGRPLPGATSSCLLECTTAAGAPALLRIRPDVDLVAREALGLWAWSGVGAAPRVLSSNAASGSILFERVQGTSLDEELVSADEGERVAGVLRRLHATPVPTSGVPGVEEFVLSRLQGALGALPHFPSAPVSAKDLHLAVSRVERLALRSHRRVLLHGDLSPERVLTTSSGDVLVVSPKPLVGDPSFDVAMFALHKDPSSAPEVAAALSSMLSLDGARTREWLRVLGPDLALLATVYDRGTTSHREALAALAR